MGRSLLDVDGAVGQEDGLQQHVLLFTEAAQSPNSIGKAETLSQREEEGTILRQDHGSLLYVQEMRYLGNLLLMSVGR